MSSRTPRPVPTLTVASGVVIGGQDGAGLRDRGAPGIVRTVGRQATGWGQARSADRSRSRTVQSIGHQQRSVWGHGDVRIGLRRRDDGAGLDSSRTSTRVVRRSASREHSRGLSVAQSRRLLQVDVARVERRHQVEDGYPGLGVTSENPRWTGAAPRQAGSSEKCALTPGWGQPTSSGISTVSHNGIAVGAITRRSELWFAGGWLQFQCRVPARATGLGHERLLPPGGRPAGDDGHKSPGRRPPPERVGQPPGTGEDDTHRVSLAADPSWSSLAHAIYRWSSLSRPWTPAEPVRISTGSPVVSASRLPRMR